MLPGGAVQMPDVKKTEENNFPAIFIHEGTNVKAYEYMGLHKAAVDGGEGMSCRVMGAQRPGSLAGRPVQRMGRRKKSDGKNQRRRVGMLSAVCPPHV